jgi:glycosyltransferase involved in cell wall biosynthesis
MFGTALKGFDAVMRRFIELHGLTKQIQYRGFVPYTELRVHYEKASVGVVPIPNIDRFKNLGNGTSRKIFEYMNAGLPVVGPDFGECALVVKEEDCGVLVNTSDSEAIAHGILYCLQNAEEAQMMGMRGKEAVRKKYNWQMESERLLSVFRRL